MKAFRLAYVLLTAMACGTYGEQVASPAADAAVDASSDASPSDASLADTVLPDATAGSCEVLVGSPLFTGASNIAALAADAVHVYWAGTEGVTRAALNVANTPPEAVFRDLGAATHVVVGDFVAARFADGALRVVSKTDIAADASTPNMSANGIDPRSAAQFFARRVDRTFSCVAASSTCAGVVEHPGVTSIATAPTGGFDFMAREGAGAGVFHCPSDCGVPDAGRRLATASAASTQVASDAEFVYWIDRTAGEVRKVSRAGGAPTAVITALVEPVGLAIDPLRRIIVATLSNGVLRGPASGCVAPATSATGVIAALALQGSTVLWAEGATIEKAGP